MTKQTVEATQEVMSFDERIEILAKELELAIKWQRPCVLLVVYSSEYVRSDVEAALENHLFDLGQKSVRLTFRNRQEENVISVLREFQDPENAVFLVHGLHWGHDDANGTYSTLNLQREFFIERQVRAVFWLTQNEIVALARFAPDFWAYRHRVIEFVDSPKGEQLLREALESEWQGTGEYAGDFEDTDAKISLRESLLTELPQGEEATAVRGNLLLTLAILNWRKGDFEKASEQLRDALKIATRIEDGWFEAECYNALALIKTSSEQPDEAINAYKQAIHLAPDQIFAWNNLGNLCAKIGRNDEAMYAFRKAVECNPKDPIAWNGLANLHYKLGYMDDAVAGYRKAVEFMPSFAQPWNGLGDVYASMGRFDEAMKAYHHSIDLNRQYITPWLRLGVLFSRQERYREAGRAYQRALALDPRNSAAWNELGNVHLKTEALEEAAEAFTKAIELDRGFGWAYSNLAYAYTLQGKYRQTVSLLLRSIELLDADKDKAVSWNRLANVYRLLNDYDNAIAAYQMADKLDLGSATGRDMAAPEQAAEETLAEPEPVIAADKTEAEADDDELAKTQPIAAVRVTEPAAEPEAEEVESTCVTAEQAPEPKAEEAVANEPQAVIEAAPDAAPSVAEPIQAEAAESAPAVIQEAQGPNMDAMKWNDEGNACFNRGDFEDAITAYNRALRVDPKFGIPYSNLALTYLTQGRFAQAVLLYQKAIELLQSDAEKAMCWNGLGNAYRSLKEYPNAMAAYQKATELDPETAGIRERAGDFQAESRPRDAQGWNDLGELFVKTGSVSEAMEAFRHAIDLEPGAGKAYSNLARTLVAQNKYQEAIPLYQRSIELLEDNKDKAAAWNRLGNAYRKLNDYDNAIKAYQKAVVLADEGVDLLTRTRFSLLSNCYVNP